jgi:aldehyde dehydrogenase (NAD+)
VTAHIVPWNYPRQIVGRSVGRGAGDGQCLRAEREEACLTVLAFARIAHEPGCRPAR